MQAKLLWSIPAIWIVTFIGEILFSLGIGLYVSSFPIALMVAGAFCCIDAFIATGTFKD